MILKIQKLYGPFDHVENYSGRLLEAWEELNIGIQKIKQMKNNKAIINSKKLLMTGKKNNHLSRETTGNYLFTSYE